MSCELLHAIAVLFASVCWTENGLTSRVLERPLPGTWSEHVERQRGLIATAKTRPETNGEQSALIGPFVTGELKSKFLQGLRDPDRKAVLLAGSHRRFVDRSVAADERDTANRLFLLLRGSARYFFLTPEGEQVYLLWLTAGDVFGLATLLVEPAHFLVSTEVDKDAHVLVWQRETIRGLAAKYVTLLENALAIANDHLAWYLATHLSLICHTARQRLAQVLLSLARGIGRKLPTGVLLEVTNEQLASTANVTLFTVSRLMGEWRRNGAIEKSRGRVFLLNPDKLLTT